MTGQNFSLFSLILETGCVLQATLQAHQFFWNRERAEALENLRGGHLPSYALAAFTRLDHSRPAAVSGSGIIPGSRHRRGRSRPSASDSSEVEMVASGENEMGGAEHDNVGGTNILTDCWWKVMGARDFLQGYRCNFQQGAGEASLREPLSKGLK
jgi:hypothetical protein